MDPFIGEIRLFGGNFAPVGWLQCDGQSLPLAQYQALFAVIGITFGGNGSTYFNLPDLRGRVPIHQGTGPSLTPRTLGGNGGTETVTLAANQGPAHSHLVRAGAAGTTATTASGNLLNTVTPPRGQSTVPTLYGTDASVTMNASMIANADGGQPHANVQPFLTFNFIIAYTGIFPQRP